MEGEKPSVPGLQKLVPHGTLYVQATEGGIVAYDTSTQVVVEVMNARSEELECICITQAGLYSSVWEPVLL